MLMSWKHILALYLIKARLLYEIVQHFLKTLEKLPEFRYGIARSFSCYGLFSKSHIGIQSLFFQLVRQLFGVLFVFERPELHPVELTVRACGAILYAVLRIPLRRREELVPVRQDVLRAILPHTRKLRICTVHPKIVRVDIIGRIKPVSFAKVRRELCSSFLGFGILTNAFNSDGVEIPACLTASVVFSASATISRMPTTLVVREELPNLIVPDVVMQSSSRG